MDLGVKDRVAALLAIETTAIGPKTQPQTPAVLTHSVLSQKVTS